MNLRPIKLDTRNINWLKQGDAPIIGKFKHYVINVHTYFFTDQVGHVEQVHATPSHPFYVQNRQAFVPINQITDTDQLLVFGRYGTHVFHLMCRHGRHDHCGVLFIHNTCPVAVYNFEIYKRHVYRVGKSGLLVHNICLSPEEEDFFHSFGEKAKLLPKSAFEAQKNMGKIIEYSSASGSKYKYSFLVDGPPEFYRYVSDEKVLLHDYPHNEFLTVGLVSSYHYGEMETMTHYLYDFLEQPRPPVASSWHVVADNYFHRFIETETPGIYSKEYLIDGRTFNVPFDATFTTTGYKVIDVTQELGHHAGSEIVIATPDSDSDMPDYWDELPL